MNDFEKYFYHISDKPIHKWAHYFNLYEKHFSSFKNRPIKIMEIGVQNGGSLQMWRNYFHSNSKIVGIDIDASCKQHEDDNIEIHIGDQTDILFLNKLIEIYKNFDIIIDDGSHINEHVINTFNHLFPFINNSGIYFIEDVHTSYWTDCNGGFKKENSIIEYSKNLIDQINAHFSQDLNLRPNYYTNNIGSISYHDSIVVFEKQIREYTPYDLITHKGNIIDRELLGKKLKIN